ncbi:MAG: hypothetical protein M3209_15640 [Acidobacteriota bacterium]|nr:hypothetical protein [Acidobacteriota bacterium]
MPEAICPECESDVYVDEDMERGELVTCEECGTDLEVLSSDPPEVRLYDESNEYDDEDDFDDDDDLDDEDDDDFDEDDDDLGFDDEDEDDRY